MDKQVLQEIEAQERMSYRNGENIAKCEACGREVDLLIEKIRYFGGNICSGCYKDVNNH